MTFNEPNLIVKMLVILPSWQKGLPPSEVDKETQYIIDNIVNKPNSEIVNSKEDMEKIISTLKGRSTRTSRRPIFLTVVCSSDSRSQSAKTILILVN